MHFTHPLQALRHHVTGAIQRGAPAIIEQRMTIIELPTQHPPQRSTQLAAPTLPPEAHRIHHSSAGDIAAHCEAGIVLKNWLIIGHFARLQDAETTLAAARTIRGAEIETSLVYKNGQHSQAPCLFAKTRGGTTRRIYTVLARDVTPPDVDALRHLFPAPKRTRKRKTCQADTIRHTPHSAASESAQDIAAVAGTLGVETFAILLQTSDTVYASQVRSMFLAAAAGQRGNWRLFWRAWAAQLPATPETPAPAPQANALITQSQTAHAGKTHAELLAIAAPYCEYGPSYNRHIATSAEQLRIRGDGKFAQLIADELAVRLEVHTPAAAQPSADPQVASIMEKIAALRNRKQTPA